MLEDLFTKIESNHIFELSDNPSEIDQLEERSGYELPEDLKEFYHHYKTVRLFDYKWGCLYRFVTANEIHITGFDIFGKYYENDGPNSWFTICDVMDGNYIAIDLASRKDNHWNYIDCFHETYEIPGEHKIIAKSFREQLEQSLNGGDDQLYYLQKDFSGYGDALMITPKTAIQRIEPVKPKWGWLGKLIQKRSHPHIQAGWRVEFTQENNSHREFFPDKDYGDKIKSFEAAKRDLEANKK